MCEHDPAGTSLTESVTATPNIGGRMEIRWGLQ